MSFSDLIFRRTYAFTEDETWEQCAKRVAHFVAGAVPQEWAKRELEQLFYKVISTKKFIPGGRYLYSAGRKIPQINNCFLFRAEDSREGWGRLVDRHVNCLATGGGCGTEYCLDEKTQILKSDLTWVDAGSLVCGDELVGFDENKSWDKTKLQPSKVLSTSHTIRPCYRIITDQGEVIASAEHKWKARPNAKKTRRKNQGYRWIETAQLIPGNVIAFATEPWQSDCSFDGGWLSGVLDGEGWSGRLGNGGVAQNEGLVLDKIRSLFIAKGIRFTESVNVRNEKICVTLNFSGKWAKLKAFGMFRPVRLLNKVRSQWPYLQPGGKHNPPAVVLSIEYLGDREVIGIETETKTLIANGFYSHNSDIRGNGTPIKGYGGTASGPISLMAMVNEVARHVLAGGKRRSALWAGLNWQHPDIEAFITVKNWSTQIRASKEADFNFPAPLDMTNISVGLDDEFFKQVETGNRKAWDLYYRICKSMCKTGEPGFSINVGDKRHETLRNACTEVTSEFDSDTCNLGSVNLSRIDTLDELKEVTEAGILFLYCGTFLGWMPQQDFANVRDRIRRVGIGLMGVHEWCLKNDLPYGESDKLALWLSTWKEASECAADDLPRLFPDAPRPIALRAIAPTGTIGIIGETTTGIEPIYCVAYKRRFLNGPDGRWKYSYVVDPTAERLIRRGIAPDNIEDAYQLSHDVERRLQMQAFVQKYVDQSISSTINLPAWGEPGNNNAKQFAQTLLRYLPQLRGITVYPDSGRSGQPITPIDYAEAVKHKDVVFEESGDRCIGGTCGL